MPTLTTTWPQTESIQVLGLGTYAPHSYSQGELVEILGYRGNKFVDLIVQNAAIATRSFSKTPQDFGPNMTSDDLTEYHRHYAPLLGTKALHDAAGNHFDLNTLDALVTATSTGFMSPGMAEVMFDTHHIGRPDTQRYNLVGHGCVGTIPALQIAQSLIRSGQARSVAVVCSEAVAALFNPCARGKMAIIQHLIFGEGSAALILGEDTHNGNGYPYPRLIDSYQGLAPGSINAVVIRQRNFWEGITDRSVPDLVGKVVPGIVHGLLHRHNLSIDQIRSWSFHTGGKTILQACQACLGLTDDQMSPSYEILMQHGNMLSASVLFSLQRLIRTQHPQPGDLGVLVALGPGITAGAFLMQWHY